MDRKKLAFELHRYLTAQLEEESPVPASDSSPAVPGHSSEGEEQPAMSDGDRSRENQARLEQLQEQAWGCVQCRLSKNRTQVVFGQGDAGARVFVIGEAPGAQEDEQGVPFVGAAGELLRGGFKKVGLDEEQLYITNTVKCRPPENRDPRSDELDACRPYLDRQLEIINPEVVLTLGTFALQYCLGSDRRISETRGEVFDWKDRTLIPTYHPAYILRNRSQAQTFLNDLNRVATQVQSR